MSRFYSLAGISYRLEGDRLVKAKGESPGQLSLLDGHNWEESKHGRDSSGKFSSGGGSTTKGDPESKSDDKPKSGTGNMKGAIAHIKASQDGAVEHFKQKAQQYLEKVKTMPLQELNNGYNLESELNDKIRVGVNTQLINNAKELTHPDHHEELDDIDLDSHLPKLDKAYNSFLSKIDKAIDKRIEELEGIQADLQDEAVSDFEDEVDSLTDDVGSVEEWHSAKEVIRQKYGATVAKFQHQAQKHGVGAIDLSDLKSSLEDALQTYPDDPEAWKEG